MNVELYFCVQLTLRPFTRLVLVRRLYVHSCIIWLDCHPPEIRSHHPPSSNASFCEADVAYRYSKSATVSPRMNVPNLPVGKPLYGTLPGGTDTIIWSPPSTDIKKFTPPPPPTVKWTSMSCQTSLSISRIIPLFPLG